MKSNLLLANPVSGRGKGARILRETMTYFEQQKLSYQVIAELSLRNSLNHLSSLNLANFERIFLLGGDGMIHHGINALGKIIYPNIPIGVIPAGTGNDFARALGLNIKNPIKNLDHFLSHPPNQIDLGEVNGRRFAAICSTGFDSIVNERANQMKWPQGKRKYDIAMMQELPRFKPRKYQISVDKRRMEVSAMLIAVANGPSYGGGMKICPNANLFDGQLDVMILHPISKFEFLRIFPKVYSGAHISHPQVEMLRGEEITIEGDAVTYADGERIAPTPVKIKSLPKALLSWTSHG